MVNIKKNKILVKEKHIYVICTMEELKKIEKDLEYMKSNKLLEVNNKRIIKKNRRELLTYYYLTFIYLYI